MRAFSDKKDTRSSFRDGGSCRVGRRLGLLRENDDDDDDEEEEAMLLC